MAATGFWSIANKNSPATAQCPLPGFVWPSSSTSPSTFPSTSPSAALDDRPNIAKWDPGGFDWNPIGFGWDPHGFDWDL